MPAGCHRPVAWAPGHRTGESGTGSYV